MVCSGLFDDETPWLDGPTPSWLRGEPAARQSLASGAELVLFSGDKLVGGPQAGLVFTRSQIVDAVRGDDYPVTDRSVDVQIVGLRKKLGDCGKYIETVRGVGYRMNESP